MTGSPITGRTLRWGIGVCAVLSLCFVWGLSGVSIDLTDHGAGERNLNSLWVYWLLFGLLWLGLSYVGWCLRAQGTPRHGRERVAVWVIMLVAALLRLGTVFTSSPQLSDDIWRYIHDGRQVASGVNPYAHSPAELLERVPDDAILPKINHPDLVTIYLPTSQAVFGMLWWLHPAELDPLGDVTFRMGFTSIDLLTVVLLLCLLRRGGWSVWWAVMYAWHPLVISEVAGSGHQDVIGIALLLIVVRLVGVGCAIGFWKGVVGGLLMAGVVMVKPVALPIAVPMMWRMKGHRVGVLGCVFGGLVGIGLLSAPLWLNLDAGGRWLHTATTFTGTWAFNSPVHQPLAYLAGSTNVAGIVVGGILIVVLMVSVWRGDSVACSAQRWLFASLLLSSTVYPWYLLWALAFWPLCFSPGLWVFSLVIVSSYAVLGHIEQWRVPVWVMVGEYAPVFLAFLIRPIWWDRFIRGPSASAHIPQT